jgi:hypothetical protein
MDNYDPSAQQQNGNESQYMAQQSYLPQFIPAAPNHFFEATTTLPRKSTRGFRRRFENLDWAPEQYLEMVDFLKTKKIFIQIFLFRLLLVMIMKVLERMN